MGMAECIRGILAFFACPLFGLASDAWGRKRCLLVTVVGTLTPVCSLAFWQMEDYDTTARSDLSQSMDTEEDDRTNYFSLPLHRMDLFVILLALSGLFSSTFTLTFAYISDVVPDKNGRVSAYGLALATFGLSFTIGPLLGGYLADGERSRWWDVLDSSDSGRRRMVWSSNMREMDAEGQHRVFVMSFVLAVVDLMYIYFVLPESIHFQSKEFYSNDHSSNNNLYNLHEEDYEGQNNNDESINPTSKELASTASESQPHPAGVGVTRRTSFWFNPLDSIRYLTSDPLLSIIGRLTFLYYTALHAVISTLVLYAVRQFHLGPHRLGELMAALGLSTMISEAVLVRIAIPILGEKLSMRVGLISFTLQCTLLAVANRPWHLFACAVLAIPGNLVYPSVSSLVTTTVSPERVGRALGAVNGVKSLTEGVGPLVFGTLLTRSEKDGLPGWPYLIAAAMTLLAFWVSGSLPSGDGEEEYNTFDMDYKYNMKFREDEEETEDLLIR